MPDEPDLQYPSCSLPVWYFSRFDMSLTRLPKRDPQQHPIQQHLRQHIGKVTTGLLYMHADCQRLR